MGVLINPVHFRCYWGARYNIWSIGDHSAQLLNTYAACRCAESVLRINGGIIWLWIRWCYRCDWYWWDWLWHKCVHKVALHLQLPCTYNCFIVSPYILNTCLVLLIFNVSIALSTRSCRSLFSIRLHLITHMPSVKQVMYICMHTH